MAVRTSKPKVTLDDRIDVPYKDAVGGSLANKAFWASITILALAKVHSLASCLSGSLADDPTRMKWSRTNVPWIHVRVPRTRYRGGDPKKECSSSSRVRDGIGGLEKVHGLAWRQREVYSWC